MVILHHTKIVSITNTPLKRPPILHTKPNTHIRYKMGMVKHTRIMSF